MLDDYGLVSALNWFSERFQTLTGLRVEVEGSEELERLGQEMEIGLFRIVQEALTNVARHAEATSVRIGLEPAPGGVTLSIRDDGKGFEQPGSDRRKKQRHWGLAIMRERARAVGGQLFVESEPGKGTCITVKVRAGGKHEGVA
jgi:signal transduction histidine kinase